MKKNIIYLESSERMSNIPDKSIDMIVTSPPYNIDIKYGNKTELITSLSRLDIPATFRFLSAVHKLFKLAILSIR